MLFNTLEFASFFAAVYAVYLFLPHRAQNRFLLVASWFFYAWWDWRFLGLLLISTAVDFVAARRIAHGRETSRKRWLALSVATNLGILGFFKYFDFFVGSAESLLGVLGARPELWRLDLVLPIGISFYTFQTMSYTIDVYRGKVRPLDDVLDFALYVAFFPQLVAGPIERADHLVPQITSPRRVDPEGVRDGLFLIAGGLFKKTFIADNCADIVAAVFGAGGTPTGAEWIVAIYAFAFQIYGDFSGYSDIARGLGRLMGFDLMLNFDLPYFAASPTEFWRRWHISLSTWLRDYLYVPLGGNRKGRVRTYVNVLATMLLGGLWHGATWTMVLWGAYHGLALVLDRARRGLAGSGRAAPSRLSRLFGALFTFHLVALGWLVFRAESLAQVGEALSAILRSPFAGGLATEMAGRLALLALPLVAYQLFQYRRGDPLIVARWSPRVRFGVATLLLLITSIHYILYARGFHEGHEFIYFQF